jgi:hypothetical protein
MNVHVTGGNKLQKEIARQLCEFFKAKYLSKFKTIRIDISIEKNLAEDCGCDGACTPIGGNRGREFEIEIDRDLSLIQFMKTLTHELTHVRQYVTGDMVEVKGKEPKTLWKGKDYSKVSYSKQPWERQAFRLQESLYLEFLASTPSIK